MFFNAYDFKGQTCACVCRTSENRKSLVLQDRCNIEIFLSSASLIIDSYMSKWVKNLETPIWYARDINGIAKSLL